MADSSDTPPGSGAASPGSQQEWSELSSLIGRSLAKSPKLSGYKVKQIDPLCGDASTRTFYRVTLSGGSLPSVIVIRLSSSPGPVGGGKRQLTQDDTFVEIGRFLFEHQIRVPEIYFDGRADKILIVEDVGDLSLRKIATRECSDTEQQKLEQLAAPTVIDLFKSALAMLISVRKLELPKDSIIAERKPSFEQYRKQIPEIADFILANKGLRTAERKVIDSVFDAVCESINSHPKAISHYDFVAHNIFVHFFAPASKPLTVMLDFQDMCIDSTARDIASLLNDRDIDSALGNKRQSELIEFVRGKAALPPDFMQYYTEYLFHWDCRVSGRFALLSEVKGKPVYKQWIPGTLRRLGRTSLSLISTYPRMADFIEICSSYSPELAEVVRSGGRW